MTSEQVMLMLLALALGVLPCVGCAARRADGPAPTLVAPYERRQVWAVAPLRNESGSRFADGVAVADQFARRFEQARGLDVIPVNRVLAAMETLQLGQVSSEPEAMRLLRILGVDGVVVGTISAYDPYDPPRLGLAVELYTDPRLPESTLDLRRLSLAAVDDMTRRPAQAGADGQPVSVVSGFFDAADPAVRTWLDRYAAERGRQNPDDDPRLYRLSMDRFTEFVTYTVSSHLLRQETQRVEGSPGHPEGPRSQRDLPQRETPRGEPAS